MEGNEAYLTLMGRSGWAVVNSLYAVVIETKYRPDRVLVLYESQLADEVKPVLEGIRIVQGTYTTPSVIPIEIPTWDAVAARNAVEKTVSELKANKSGVALDITGGRKALVAGTLLAVRGKGVDHVYYLAIDTTVGVAKPYPMIPRSIQKLIDLMTMEAPSDSTALEPRTGTKDLVLTREELMVVLNQAYARGESIVVNAPLIGLDLLVLDLKERRARMLIGEKDYTEKRSTIGCQAWDHPSFSDFLRCLCYCGVLDFENGGDFRELLVKDLSKSHELRTGVRRAVLSLDSNMFYDGFASCLERLEESRGIRSQDVRCVTSYAVVKEIQKDITAKYQRDAILAAKEHCKDQQRSMLLDEFLGQNVLQTRAAKMAKSELTKFMQRPFHEKTEKILLPSDKEKVDMLIVESLEKFAKDTGTRVILVSTDRNMHDHCELADDIGAMILRFPREVPPTFAVSDKGFADLLVELSILYGVLKLEKIGYLFGEYRGKGSSEYTNAVKLRFHSLHRGRIVEERVEVCRKLMKLGLTN